MCKTLFVLTACCFAYFSSSAQFLWQSWNVSNSVMPSNEVQDVISNGQAQDDAWVAFWGLGLTHLKNGGTNYSTANSGLPSDSIYCLALDQNDSLLVGTTAGLVLKTGSTWTLMDTSNSGIPDNHIRKIAVDLVNNDFYVATINGIGKFSNGSWTVYNTSNSGLASNDVIDLDYTSTNDALWVATDQGVSQLHNGQWSNFNSSNSGIPNFPITGIATIVGWYSPWQPPPNPLPKRAAVSTLGGGIAISDNLGTQWSVFDTSNSTLPSNTVNDIDFGIGLLFMGTDQALSYSGAGLSYFEVNDSASGQAPCDHITAVNLQEGSTFPKLQGNRFFGTEHAGVFSYFLAIGVEEELDQEAVQVFPNPANDQLVLQSSYAITSYTIFDLHGRTVFEQKADQLFDQPHKDHLDVSPLPNGSYFLQVQTTEGQLVRKFAIQR